MRIIGKVAWVPRNGDKEAIGVSVDETTLAIVAREGMGTLKPELFGESDSICV